MFKSMGKAARQSRELRKAAERENQFTERHEKIQEFSAIFRACGIPTPALSSTTTPESLVDSLTKAQLEEALYFLQDPDNYTLSKAVNSWGKELQEGMIVSQNSSLWGRIDAFLSNRREFNQLLYEFEQESGIDLRNVPDLEKNIGNLAKKDLNKLFNFLRGRRQTSVQNRGPVYDAIHQRLTFMEREEQRVMDAMLNELEADLGINIKPTTTITTLQRINNLSKGDCEKALNFIDDKGYVQYGSVLGRSDESKLYKMIEQRRNFLLRQEQQAQLERKPSKQISGSIKL